MLVIGLTGGIGAGKSTVASLFAEHGVPIIDTDLIARQITQPGKKAFKTILAHFAAESLLTKEGTLDRAKLRQIIFTHPEERRWLEDLLHPLIRDEMEQQIKKLSTPYCMVVVPLLFEVEFYSMINRILVVDAPETAQVERVMSRDHVSKAQIEAILKTQATRHDRLARAHDIIINEGNIDQLVPQVEKLHKMYLDLSQLPPS